MEEGYKRTGDGKEYNQNAFYTCRNLSKKIKMLGIGLDEMVQ